MEPEKPQLIAAAHAAKYPQKRGHHTAKIPLGCDAQALPLINFTGTPRPKPTRMFPRDEILALAKRDEMHEAQKDAVGPHRQFARDAAARRCHYLAITKVARVGRSAAAEGGNKSVSVGARVPLANPSVGVAWDNRSSIVC
jgi:hypothetical protein